MTQPALAEFFFESQPSVVRLQMFEIDHSAFDQPYWICRNSGGPIYVRHETGGDPFEYQYYPCQIKPLGVTNSLDQSIEITFGDLGQLLPDQITRIAERNRFGERPFIVYREYASNNTEEDTVEGEPVIAYVDPIYGPFTLEIDTLTFNKSGCVFVATPKKFNRARIGEIYDPGRFPMLRGFL